MKRLNWEVGSTWHASSEGQGTVLRQALKKVLPPEAFGDWKSANWLSTCRSAIAEALKSQTFGDGKVALVPGFTCHSVVEPILKAGWEVIPYTVNTDLSANAASMENLLKSHKPSVVLTHGYFGFDTLRNLEMLLLLAQVNGVAVIEDRTQTMFSTHPPIYTYYKLGSLRKWFPIPDGAYLSPCCTLDFEEDKELSDAKAQALLAKHEYLIYGKGEKACFQKKFGDAERLLDSREQTFGISKRSVAFLEQADLKDFRARRRANYKFLSDRLARHSELEVVFPHLDANTVPFMLPVLVREGRSEFQRFMASRNVYPTVIWGVPRVLKGKITEATQTIYDSILCFHIDQRYDLEDMAKVADLADTYFSKDNA